MPAGISAVGGNLPLPSLTQRTSTEAPSTESFQKLLSDAVGTLSRLQGEADASAARLAAGEPVELHEVLLATERASIAFQLAVQVRNKVVEAYQEVMRMQL